MPIIKCSKIFRHKICIPLTNINFVIFINNKLNPTIMKIKITLLLLVCIALISTSFKNKKINPHHYFRSGGAAAIGQAGRTGASFDNGGSTCATCHSGGSYAPTMSVTLLDNANNPVAAYTLNTNYKLRIAINATNGTPDGLGFQALCAKQSDNSNINNWGIMPTNTQNTFLAGNGRNYVEQLSTMSLGVIDIPWTSPATAVGAVRFYTMGNLINGSGDASGDSPTSPNVLTISQAVLPVSFVSFKTSAFANNISLQWITGFEQNNNYFAIEQSEDGISFKNIQTVNSQGNSTTDQVYNFTIANVAAGVHFFRIMQVDNDGKKSYSTTNTVKIDGKKIDIFPNPINAQLFLQNVGTNAQLDYSIINSIGSRVLTGRLNSNSINVLTLSSGTYFLVLKDKNGNTYTGNFFKR
jgi:hypothetical protein